MATHSLSHLSDGSVERGLAERSTRERLATAELLPYLAEFDARKLYRPHGFNSTYAYCVKVLGFSEDAACKRIEVARRGRLHPEVFRGIADGSPHLSGAAMLARHLTTGNAAELLAAAAHRTRAGIEQLLAERFPQPDVPTRLVPLVPAASTAAEPVAPDPRPSMPAVGESSAAVPPAGESVPPEAIAGTNPPLVPDLDVLSVPGRIGVVGPPPRLKPLAPERFGLQATIDRATHDDLRRAQELLRHQVPDGNVPEVLKRALRLLVRTLEQRKCGLTEKPRAARPAEGASLRHIPAHVRRAVWQRDGGRCTFRSATGHRCEARGALEFDHEIPVARGGRSTPGNLRLRCRAHNQLEAERA